jgi:hypothetical protein
MTTKHAVQVRCGGVATGQETGPDCPRPTGRLTHPSPSDLRGDLFQGDGVPEPGGGLPGEPGDPPGLQGRGDVLPGEPGGLADAGLACPVRAGANSVSASSSAVKPRAVLVDGVHVEELPGLVVLPVGGQVVRHLAEPEPLGGGEPPVPSITR